ncbi:MAG TPA: alpha/beta hydrolase fold domain-containing protein, partial [Prosthecobacter sp.]|nr:alpha/beta hydrolase fold domain-containing protein [Prosthecobacter sp.]
MRFLALALILPALAPAQAPVHRLTLDEFETTLRHWRTEHPKLISYERRGYSADSLPIYLLKVTDSTVPDADKEVCLITSLHGGPERLGCTGALAITEWLLSDDPEAVETRRRQIVLTMPVNNPLAFFYTDRFTNGRGLDPYTGSGRLGKLWDVAKLELKNEKDAPEVAVVMGVMDQYQPEVHADLHGTGLQEFSETQLGDRKMRQGTMITEVTGSAYSNYALRPWDWRVTEAMIAAGREAGFPSDRFEADAQRTFWGPELAPLGKKLWSGQPMFYSAHYGYARHHTMTLAMEVAWEDSAVARMKGLFRIGNRPWGEEKTAGYPVNRVKNFVGQFVTAYGETAAARRRSRVELWEKQSRFSLGFLYPQTKGRASLICAISPEAKAEMAEASLDAAAQAMERRFGDTMAFIKSGPEIKLAMDTAADGGATIENGIGFRLRLSDVKAGIREVRLNGVGLKESAADGYQAWPADGFTQLQVNVPPDKAAKTDLFVVTCDYEPSMKRTLGWMPPAAVMKECDTEKADSRPPTIVDARYGPHFRQTLDLWLPKADKPVPLVFYIHGGGWAAQDKVDIHHHLDVRKFLDAGVAVASINYRFILDATAADVEPPVKAPLSDAARALQFVRSKAPEWKLDPTRVAATGVSAGGCTSLWLAMHDDMSDPKSEDLVARQSTKVLAVAAMAPQATLDPKLMLEWMPDSNYGGHAFGLQKPGMTRPEAFPPLAAAREKLLPLIQEYSPIHHASADDPPLYLSFPRQEGAPVKGMREKDATHSALHGVMLLEALQPLGVKVQLAYPGGPKSSFDSMESFLI